MANRIFIALLLVLTSVVSPGVLWAQDARASADILKERLAAVTPAKADLPKIQGPLRNAVGVAAATEGASLSGPASATADLAVTIHASSPSQVLAHLSGIGRTPLNVLGSVVEAMLSPGEIADLARQSFVVRLQAIQPSKPLALSQGRAVHNAQNWIAGGFAATGVKVGIIDDFLGIRALMGSEIPGSVIGRCYTSVGAWSANIAACDSTSGHGTGVAESLVDIAPGAQLFIANPISLIDFANTITWMTTQGVKVINFSAAWVWDGPGDGTSPYSDSPLRAVDAAVTGGAAFVTAAGNEGESSWLGAWTDANADDLHEFSAVSGGTFNRVYLSAGEKLSVQLRWQDSWLAAARDLDLILWNEQTSSIAEMSQMPQSGSPGDTPFEFLSFTAPYSGFFSVVLSRYAGVRPSWIQVQAFTSQALEFSTPGSIGNPAESANPGVLAVGATAWSTPGAIEPYSSKGPTPDGRVKPDIVGVDRADTVTYGPSGFAGTSQASPHVAGLAALVQGAFPAYTPTQVASYLKQFAQPRGASPNTVWGYGLAYLADLCQFTIAPPSAQVANSVAEVQFTVTTGPSCSWTASSQAQWISVASGAAGTGSGIVRVQVASNPGAQRAGTLLVAGVSVTVTQGAFAVTPPNLAAMVTGSLVSFNWSGTPGATSYVLEAGSVPGAANIAVLPLGAATGFQIVAPNGTYYVRVRAWLPSGTSTLSNEVTVVVGPVPPGPMGHLSSAVVGNVATFGWTPPATGGTPSEYRLEAGSAPGLANIAVMPVQGTGLIVPGVPPGVYFVRVRAVNAAGAGAPSNEVLVSVAPPEVPGTPTGLSAVVDGTTVHLFWTPATGGGVPTDYVMAVALSPGGPPILVVRSAAPYFGTAGAPPGTYFVRVAAVNDAGISAPTSDLMVIVGS